MEAIQIEKAFDDSHLIRALVERHGPYRALASYLPASAIRGERRQAAPGATLPWFRGTWAANGRSLVEGAAPILQNARFREAASRVFGAEVIPSTIAVNVNGPMPASGIHVDVPGFRGISRDRYPLRLLQAMASSGLFESWRIVEAGAVVWFYDGVGGEYEYWPDGLSGPKRSMRAPLTNRAIVADNDRMYHRIGRIGEVDAKIPSISAEAHIAHVPGNGWVISDGGRDVQYYSDEQIRISILWKGRVRNTGVVDECGGPLTGARIAEISISTKSVK
jgi:hypothetical protein